MTVITETFTYTLYIGANGVWTMHVWDESMPEGQRWQGTVYNVHEADPFRAESTSIVTYGPTMHTCPECEVRHSGDTQCCSQCEDATEARQRFAFESC